MDKKDLEKIIATGSDLIAKIGQKELSILDRELLIEKKMEVLQKEELRIQREVTEELTESGKPRYTNDMQRKAEMAERLKTSAFFPEFEEIHSLTWEKKKEEIELSTLKRTFQLNLAVINAQSVNNI